MLNGWLQCGSSWAMIPLRVLPEDPCDRAATVETSSGAVSTASAPGPYRHSAGVTRILGHAGESVNFHTDGGFPLSRSGRIKPAAFHGELMQKEGPLREEKGMVQASRRPSSTGWKPAPRESGPSRHQLVLKRRNAMAANPPAKRTAVAGSGTTLPWSSPPGSSTAGSDHSWNPPVFGKNSPKRE